MPAKQVIEGIESYGRTVSYLNPPTLTIRVKGHFKTFKKEKTHFVQVGLSHIMTSDVNF